MMLFPALLAGGHLLIAVADKVPQLNYQPICRELESGRVGIKDSFDVCVQDEAAAREKLGREWDGFSAADRARCVRSATSDHTASYVEVLTCLELAQQARKLNPKVDVGINAPPPPNASAAIADPDVEAPPAAPPRGVAAPARRDRSHADPVSLAPPEPPPAPAAAPAYCVPGLAALIPACNDAPH